MFFWWPIRFVPDIWTACIQNSRSCWFKSHVLTLPNQENMCSFRQPDIRPPSTLALCGSEPTVVAQPGWKRWPFTWHTVCGLCYPGAALPITKPRLPPALYELNCSSQSSSHSFRVRRSSIFRRSQESSRLLSFCIIRSKPLVLSLNI